MIPINIITALLIKIMPTFTSKMHKSASGQSSANLTWNFHKIYFWWKLYLPKLIVQKMNSLLLSYIVNCAIMGLDM